MKKKMLMILCGCLVMSMLTGCSVIDKFVSKQNRETSVNKVEKTVSVDSKTEEKESIVQTETEEETQSAEKTSGVYHVKMISAGDNKIKVIKAYREITGLGLKETKELIDSAPVVILATDSKKEADKLYQALENAGAVMDEDMLSEEIAGGLSEKATTGMCFTIQKSFHLSDRGISVTGTVKEGTIHVGDAVTIKLADGTEIQNVVAGIEVFGDATKTSAETGETVGVWFEEEIKEKLDNQCEMYCEGSKDAEEEIVLYDEDNVKIVVKDVIYQRSSQFELVLNTEITNNTPNKLTIQTRDRKLTDPDGNELESEDIIFSATVSPGETVEQEMAMANNTCYNDKPQEMEGVRFRLLISAFLSDENLSNYIDIAGIQEQNMELTIEEGTEEKKGDINKIKE